MNQHLSFFESLSKNGFAILENIFSQEEINKIIELIEQIDTNKPTFRKTNDLFAIRQFLKEIPKITELIFNNKFRQLIESILGNKAFLVKSIYFDKPEQSNWFVAYHQDLTISVNQKTMLEGYGPWTVKQDQFAVQPPLEILQNSYTFRIHLDDTDEKNGALKVLPGSHAKGICRPETIDWSQGKEVFCPVKEGGVMIMRPLLLHASNKTTNHHKRRVIHLEFSNKELPAEIKWAERFELFQ
jgi:ectoine hydroxylase-related dioxygenase (phytanoyl-CoA dioxygenase family)